MQLDSWGYVNGVRNAGLENRRQREKAWCLKGRCDPSVISTAGRNAGRVGSDRLAAECEK